jgi:hypothetical protein
MATDMAGPSIAFAARYLFDPGYATVQVRDALLYIGIAVGGISWLGYIMTFMTVARGNPPPRKILWVLNVIAQAFLRFGILPLLTAVVGGICTLEPATLAVSVVSGTLLLPLALVFGLFQVELLPR